MLKSERFQEFLRRLACAPAASTEQEATELICETLNAVEDELTTIPYGPGNWRDDGRMYPFEGDSECPDPLPGVRRYRSRGHYTRVHQSGAFCIEEIKGKCLINKASQNGHQIL